MKFGVKSVLGIPAMLVLSACQTTVGSINNNTGPTSFLDDNIGATGLTYHTIDGDSGTAGNFLYRSDNGQTTVNLVDANTIEIVTFEYGNRGVQTLNLDTASGKWVDPNNSAVKFTTVDLGYFVGFYLSDQPSSGFAVSGGFGIETANMPTSGSASYTSDPFARVLMRPSSFGASEENLDVTSSGGVSFDINFGDGNAVNGTVFDGNFLIDADNDNNVDDRLAMQVLLSGTLSGNGISGTVSGGTSSLDIDDDGGASSVTLSASSSDAVANFFGTDHNIISGTWGADFDISDSTGSLLDGEAIGYFDVRKD